VLREESDQAVRPDLVSRPEPVCWSNGRGELVHGIFYAPANGTYEAPLHTLPPLLVHTHGGPNSMVSPAFDLATAYWTSRGFAVLDVNYGGSAGGFTTLACLTGTDTFAAGPSYYGVADLEALARETHKFESRYLDNLVAPYPQGRDTYVERSPIHHLDGLSAPMVLFQGLDDVVVPPAQAEQLAAALRAKGLPVGLLELENLGATRGT
jgi:dipeptidyl aminopeptidase/acylaminoacyl peptidase